MDQRPASQGYGGLAMKKRYLRPSIDCILTIMVILQFMSLAADPTASQMALYVPVQILNIILLVLNLNILSKYSRLLNE